MPSIKDLEAARRFQQSCGGGLKSSGKAKNEQELSVRMPLEVEDSRTDETLYFSHPVIMRKFWLNKTMPGFPYNLIKGASYWHHFLPVGIIVEKKKQYGPRGAQYYLVDEAGEKRQEIQQWVYDALYFIDGGCLEWNNFFVIDDDLIFELRAYTGKNNGNTIVSFIFHNQEDAEIFILPEWARGYELEITADCYGLKDIALAVNGFPDLENKI